VVLKSKVDWAGKVQECDRGVVLNALARGSIDLGYLSEEGFDLLKRPVSRFNKNRV
jgi:hypothetical protein